MNSKCARLPPLACAPWSPSPITTGLTPARFCARFAEFANVPISTEWTVPFGRVVFHIGVHNLPAASADSCMAAMREATAAADERQIFSLFAEFCSIPDVLLVFNHPLWNFDKLSGDFFQYELRRFLAGANRYMHAFELNGMRCHQENRGVLAWPATGTRC